MKEKWKKIMTSFVLCFLISALAVFGQDAQAQGQGNEQKQQEFCDGVQELEAEVFLLEQSILAAEEDGADVEVPLPETSTSSTIVQGEIPSCDEITELVGDRIEQLEAYIDENEIELLDEEDMEEIKAEDESRKQEKGNGQQGQSGNDVSATVSQGMPSCEQNTMLLRQRIADLEEFIEDNDLEVPEPSEDEAAAIEDDSESEGSSESEEEDEDDEGSDEETEAGSEVIEEKNKVERDETENPPQGFFKGVFKKMFSFLGGNEESSEEAEENGPVNNAPEVIGQPVERQHSEATT